MFMHKIVLISVSSLCIFNIILMPNTYMCPYKMIKGNKMHFKNFQEFEVSFFLMVKETFSDLQYLPADVWSGLGCCRLKLFAAGHLWPG